MKSQNFINTILATLILTLTATSCRSNNDLHIIITDDGISPVYTEAFKRFRENSNCDREKVLMTITKFLDVFKQSHRTKYNSVISMGITRENIKKILGEPNFENPEIMTYKFNSSRECLKDLTLFFTGPIFTSYSYGTIVR